MARDFFRRISPNEGNLRDYRIVRMFGSLLHDGRLWHLNRRTAAGGAAVGLFMCWFPFPVQMLLAAALAVYFRVNLPLAIAGVWITNPLTIPPMFYFAYRLGLFLTGTQPIPLPVESALSVEFIFAKIEQIWWPMLAGCGLLAVTFSGVGYFAVSTMWRIHVMRKFKRRREERRFKLHLPEKMPGVHAIRDQIDHLKARAEHRHEAPGDSEREKPTQDRE